MRAVFQLVACGSLLAACVDDPSTNTNTQNVETKNKLSSNKLASNKLASNKLASNKLASNSLANISSGKLTTNLDAAGDLLTTSDGRDVYAYLINCAIPDTVTLEAAVAGAADTAPPNTIYTCSGGVCDFPGGVGIAPEWLDRKLDPKGVGWVSACIFSRVNAHATAEPISLRGRSDALTITPDEAAQYSVQEGAFYGNLFTPDTQPIVWIACEGEGQAAGEFGGLVDRDCTEPSLTDPSITQCGFTYAGHCANYDPNFATPYACSDYNVGGGYYQRCHDAAGDGKWPQSTMYHEIITAYVTP